MKNRWVPLIPLCFAGFFAAAQNRAELAPVLADTFATGAERPVPDRVVYDLFDIEQPPVFPGGDKELLKYLFENIHFPPISKDGPIPGPMTATFVVEADGSISDKKIVRGVEFASVLLPVLDGMPRWTPGKKMGQAVAVRFILPVRVCFGRE